MGYLSNKLRQQTNKVFLKSSKANDLYFDIIINSLDGYDLDYIEKEIDKNDNKKFLDDYRRIILVRIANVLAFQIKHKVNTKYINLLENLLFTLIEDLLSNELSYGADFELIELFQSLTNAKGLINEETYGECISLLRGIDPYTQYQIHHKNTPIEKQQNFVIYSMVGEYLRGLLTGIDTSLYITENWKVQKEKFDLNGMYKDPECPMLYDTTVRAHLAYMLFLGYEGEIKSDVEVILKKSAMITLYDISSLYLFPFGGRSNSYHMNEALTASLCEYYAVQFMNKDEKKIAGAFKRTARKTISTLKRYKGYHLKNFFTRENNFGGDSYGTYEAYTVSAACFMMMGYEMNNPKIKEHRTPSEFGGYVFRLTDDFHQVFANCCGYSVQIDYAANNKYDSNGLSRIHKCKIPAELGLSMPFAKNAKYNTDDFTQDKGRAIGPFWYDGAEEVHLAECEFIKPAYIHTIAEGKKKVVFEITYYLSKGTIKETYMIDKKGVHIVSESDFANLNYHIPVLIDNGKDSIIQKYTYLNFTNRLNRYLFSVSWDKNLSCVLQNHLLYNRNGIYKSLVINGNDKKIEITLNLKERRSRYGKIKKKK